MPIGATLAAAAVTAGAGIYSANQQSKAASAGLQASTEANDKSLAAQQQALDRVTALESPFQQGGALGMQALLARLGIAQPQQGQTPTGRPANDPYYGYNIPRGTTAPPALPQGKTGSPTPMPGVPDTGAGVTVPAAPGQPPAQVPDWNGLLNNPQYADVKAWAESGHGDPNIPIDQQSMAQRAAYWVQNGISQNDPRATAALPMMADPNVPQPVQQDPNAPPPAPTAPDLMNAPRPDAPPIVNPARPDQGVAPTFARPDQGVAPTFNTPDYGAAPTYTDPTFGPAPDRAAFFGDFKADPGYQFRVDQGLRAANAQFGARGLLKSGSAMQGLNDYAQGQASQEYGNWFNRQNSLYGQALGQYNQDRNVGLNQFNTDRSTGLAQYNTDRATGLTQFNTDRGVGLNQFNTNRDVANTNFNADRSYGTNLFMANRDSANNNYNNDRSFNTNLALNSRDYNNTNFNQDRNYQAGRYDTATGNLFSLAQIGQNAAGAVGGASQSYANNAGNIYGAQANAATNAGNQRAQANAGAFGAVAGAGANLFNSLGSYGQGGGYPVATVGNAYPTIAGVAPTMPNGQLSTFQPPVF